MSRLLDDVRACLRLRHYSRRTEQAYCRWIVRFVRSCGTRHPRECGEGNVRAFLEHLSSERRVSASTQGQALAAVQFLYRDVLALPLAGLPAVVHPKAAVRLPNVLEPPEVE